MTRVWDDYLSERDRAHLATVTGPPRVPFGKRPLLMLVDNYRSALGDEPLPFLESVKRWPWSTGLEGWQAVEQTVVLLERFRELELPVVHVTAARPSEGLVRSHDAIHGTKPKPPSDDRSYEIVDQLQPLPGEMVIRKVNPSAFVGTPLLAYLNYLQVDTLVVCGESTSGCVRATVTDGSSYNYKVIVVEECVYDRHQAPHAISLFDMNRKYAAVLSLAEVLEHFSRTPGPDGT